MCWLAHLLTVAVGLALVSELSSLHTGTLGRQSRPLQQVTRLLLLGVAVGDVD